MGGRHSKVMAKETRVQLAERLLREIVQEDEATAREIAQKIEASAERCIQHEITVEECSRETDELWAQAKELGVESEVDALLQEFVKRMLRIRGGPSTPFLVLSFDEHTGREGLTTRLEAFKDVMITKKTAGSGQ